MQRSKAKPFSNSSEGDHLSEQVAGLTPQQLALLMQRLREKATAGEARQGPGYQTIEHAPRDRPLPVSFAQQRLWFIDQLEPNRFAYNIGAAVRLRGWLNLINFQRTFDELIKRHETMRTTFTAVEGQPFQVIGPAWRISMPVIDLSELNEREQKAEAQLLAREERRQPFDLAAGPLIRVKLLRFDEKDQIALLTIHHIICDGWSIGVLIREVGALYEAFSKGQDSPLPELPIQYADFSAWQQKHLEGEALEAHLCYWKHQLSSPLPLLKLSTDRPRLPIQSHHGAHRSFALSDDLSNKLKALGEQEDATLYMLLVAVFQTMLYRYTAQSDVLIGTVLAGRDLIETEGLIGLFVNTQVLRIDLSGDPTFRQLLARARDVVIGMQAHQGMPFEKLVEELQPERSLSHTPLFQVMFVFQNMKQEQLELTGLSMSPFEIESGITKFDLTLLMSEGATGLTGAIEYNTDLFDASTIDRMLGHLQVLLEGVVCNPQQRITNLPILTQTEKEQLLVEWNDTNRSYQQNECIHHLFEQRAEARPDAVAVVYEGGQLTYGELNKRANRLGHYLRGRGAGPESLIGICVERSVEMVVGLLGALKAGAAYVPLDPAYPKERLSFMLEDAQPRVLLTQEGLVEKLPKHRAEVICLDRDWGKIAQESEVNLNTGVRGENPAYVIYTSGSTGKPKGVLVEHRGLCNLAEAQIRSFSTRAEDNVLQFASLSFDASIFEMVMAFRVGAKLCLARQDSLLPSRGLFDLLCKHAITNVTLPPSMLAAMGQDDELPMLRTIIVAGEACPQELATHWSQRHGFFNAYGPTEATVWASVADCKNETRKPPIGRAIANTQIYISDERLQLVPVGIPGELHIGGAGVARGYLHRPEMTAEKFIPDPFGQGVGRRLYKTGDLACYLPDGNIDYLGRIDRQVKVRGLRIEPGEIEAVLRQCDGVREAAVITQEITANNKRLVAYLVPVEEQPVTLAELKRLLKQRLPEYMLPSTFVVLDSLPLTPNGKIDRNALPPPGQLEAESQDGFVAPHTPTQEIIAGVWLQLLGLEAVGVYDNFFDLGGHSLLVAQAVSRLREVFDVELPLRALFETPFIAGLAELIDSALSAGHQPKAPAIERVPRNAQIPLSFAQQSLWFLHQLEPDSSAYNITSAVHLKGAMNLAAMQQTLREIVRRHEMLRTTFETLDGKPVQAIHDAPEAILTLVDLSGLQGEQANAIAERLAAEDQLKPFDLNAGPLMRAALLRLAGQNHLLLFSMHHIISDWWSTGVLMREAAALYGAFCKGEESPLEELPIQYSDYAVWQRGWLRGEVLDEQLDYWKRHLSGAPDLLELPTDHPRSTAQQLSGAGQSVILSKELTESLRDLSRREGVTLYMTLLGSFKALLYRYTGCEDLLVGTPVANRNKREIEGLIGFFVNTLVLRTDLSGDLTFSQLLKRVREVSLGAYAHQDLPFEKLVEELQPERSLSYTPLFQVMFVMASAAADGFHLPGLTLSRVSVDRKTVNFALVLSASERAETLAVSFDYMTELFEASTIRRMLDHFQNLLEEVVEDSGRRLSELKLLREAERHQVLVEWNDTQREYADGSCIHIFIERQAQRTPGAIAATFEDKQLTYRELNVKANDIAHALIDRGIGKGDYVPILMDRGLAVVISMLAVMKVGAAFVPLDLTWPAGRIRSAIDELGGGIILVDDAGSGQLGEVSASPLLVIAEPPDKLRDDPGLTVGELDPLYAIYTSGSTGKPKAAVVAHRGITNRFLWMNEYFGAAAASVLQTTRHVYDSAVWQLFWPMINGGKTVIPLAEKEMDADYIAGLIEEQEVTITDFVPSVFNAIVPRILSNGRAKQKLQTLRAIIIGGEEITPATTYGFMKQFPEVRVVNLYGPTEASIGCICYEVTGREGARIPIGRPIANTRILILDQNMSLVPVGVVGEIYITGKCLGLGYLNDEEKTASAFVANHFEELVDKKLYKTGDLARYLPDGNIEFLGRKDQQVKIRGFRIELGEIEAALRQHDQVREAVVLAKETEAGGKRLIGCVIAENGSEPSAKELRDYLREKLPDYMVPLSFVLIESFPLTPSGKVDRRLLTDTVSVSVELETTLIPPRTDLEKIIAQVWQEVLQLNQVGINDNFFDLGGHSLLVVQVSNRLRELLNREVPIVRMFQYPTISSLANYLSQDQGDRAELERRADVAEKWREARSSIGEQFEQMARAAKSNGKVEKYDPQTASQKRSLDIAIIGMSGRFPGASDLNQFWHNLQQGKESIVFFSDEELLASGVDPSLLSNPQYIKAAAPLDDIDLFDAGFFGFSPREAEVIDPQQRLFLECAWEALESAGYDPERYKGAIGMYAGVGLNNYYLSSMRPNPEVMVSVGRAQTVLGNDKDFLTTRASYKLNLRGPSVAVQTACSTSLVATHLACQSLLSGECDMALAGGVTINIPQKGGYIYQEGGIASPDGHCRTFDEKAAGTVGGSGVGIVVLKRLRDAIADRDNIIAVIKGSAINNDGSMKVGYTAPSVEGQAEVITRAQALAGADPETISYIEAHGTGTALGDPIEVAALTQVFRASTDKKAFCAIGSVKTNIGHVDTAAGVAGLIKTALALKHKMIPPSLHFHSPNPKLDLDISPFYVNTELSSWHATATPRRAGVSSFGIGGTNAHLVLEESPAIEPSAQSADPQLIVLSARTATALNAAAGRLTHYLKQYPAVSLADVAFTLQEGRKAFPHRMSLVCSDVEEAIAALTTGKRVYRSVTAQRPPKIVFMFPGQGSQYVGMGSELYGKQPQYRQVIDMCREVADEELGIDLRLVLEGRGEERGEGMINETMVTQMAMFAVELGLARMWISKGVKPEAMIGHSLGEYVAACVAGVMSDEEGARLVARRGRLMQGARRGAMLAVAMSEEEARRVAEEWSGVEVGAINGPRQSVLTGEKEEVEEIERRLREEGVGSKRLRTSHGFHSRQMEEVRKEYVKEVRGVRMREPEVRYVSNVTGRWARGEEVKEGEYWGRQMREAVRYWEGLEEIRREKGERVMVEVGPGEVLSRIARQTSRGGGEEEVISTIGEGEGEEIKKVLEAAGRMWANGVEVDWQQMRGTDARCRREMLPGHVFERERYWIEVDRGEQVRGKVSKREDISEWFYVPVWRETVALGNGEGRSNRKVWMVVKGEGEDGAIGEEVAERLEEAGEEVIRVIEGGRQEVSGGSEYRVRSGEGRDYEAVMEELARQGKEIDKVLHTLLVMEREEGVGVEGRIRDEAERGFYSVVRLAQAIGNLGVSRQVDMVVLTSGVEEVSGDEEIEPEKAMVVGASKVIPQEYPNISCRYIDVIIPIRDSWRQETISLLIDELTSNNTDPIVAYRGGRRWVQGYEAVKLGTAEEGAGLRQSGVYLITGGLGGVGMALGQYLARSVKAKLVLTSRQGLPERSQWEQWITEHGDGDEVSRRIERVKQLEGMEAEVEVMKADVTEEEQMREVVSRARQRFGQINGVIHAAGIAGGGIIQLQDTRRMEAVLRPKVKGTRVLEEVLKDEPIDWLVLCSSQRSILGGVGRVEYSSANAYLDAYAKSKRRDKSRKTISINWDTWKEAGMALKAAEVINNDDMKYVEGMTNEQGVEVFKRVIARMRGQVIVSTRDFNHLVKKSNELRASKAIEEVERITAARGVHERPQMEVRYEGARNEIEKKLIEIWERALGIQGIGVHDDFFDLGGDSVISIQIASKANQAGMRLIPGQLFKYQTIAELAQVATLAESLQIDQQVEEGEVELTPIQEWFFEQQIDNRSHYNQAVMLEAKQQLDEEVLRKVISKLIQHHDALRMRYSTQAGKWKQELVRQQQQQEVVTVIDLSQLDESRQSAALQQAAEQVQESLDIQEGPIVRVAVYKKAEQATRLQVVIHHLTVDGVSWRILLEDLQRGYEQAIRGERIELAAKTSSYKRWAEALKEYAQTQEVREQVSYWATEQRQEVRRIRVDRPEGSNKEKEARTIRVSLSEEETKQLLQEVPAAYNTRIDEILLSGLAKAYRRWSGESKLMVDVEGHGREEVEEGVDVTRTVGWFTSIYPVMLDITGARSEGEVIKRVKEQVRGVPSRGIGYGLLRYKREEEEIRDRMRQMGEAEISFLYLGQFDQTLDEGGLFRGAKESAGEVKSKQTTRKHKLQVNGYVSEGSLQMAWRYSERLHERETIMRVSEYMMEALRQIITHCQSPEAGGYTPSDFPEAQLSQEDLDALLAETSQ